MILTKEQIIIQLRNIEKMCIDYMFEQNEFIPRNDNGEYHLEAIDYAIDALENPEIDLQSMVTVDGTRYYVHSIHASNSYDRGREITIEGSQSKPVKPINSYDLVKAYCEKEGLDDFSPEKGVKQDERKNEP